MAVGRQTIFVQIDIAAPIQRVWELTQDPQQHQRWDLRFTEIDYLPRPDPNEPQRFRYATRIGFGAQIRGEGESVGEGNGTNGARSSALRFWSADPKSLIREGSGYWKYIPTDSGTRFLTAYDYATRFGFVGRWFDHLVFRPLMGWATAWSFDRLRLWIEHGIDPADALRRSLAYVVARTALAIMWIYQGIVPKLIDTHVDELKMLGDGGLSLETSRLVLRAVGVGEVVLGVLMLIGWRWRWPLWATLILMPIALLGVCIASPGFLMAPFNPITLNLCVLSLAVIGLLMQHDRLPSARRCLRRPAREDA